jgi:hypothetical protein
LASFKGERHEFLVRVIETWYSDDNAIVREHFRRKVVRVIGPQFAAIIRQGVAEGSFVLTQPDLTARVVLSLMLDTGDQAGALYLARHAGTVSLDEVRAQLGAYVAALERVLGVAPGTLTLIDEPTLHLWFDPAPRRSTNPPRWSTDPPSAARSRPKSTPSRLKPRKGSK